MCSQRSNEQLSIVLDGQGFHNAHALLEESCVEALNWPVSVYVTEVLYFYFDLIPPTRSLDNTKREDISFIGFQFWVLGMSTVAVRALFCLLSTGSDLIAAAQRVNSAYVSLFVSFY